MKRILSFAVMALAFLAAVVLVAAASSDANNATGIPEKPPELVAVLSDYGTKDFYAGALEGAIYSANPDVKISTITHEVDPFNIAEGSYLLSQAAKMYPPGTVFIAAVDPGSGPERSLVLVSEDGKMFVAPDNGILTGVMDELGVAHVYEITNQSFMKESGENQTFQSWYIYAPAAARLASGIGPEDVGQEVFDPVRLPMASAEVDGSEIRGSIAHVDRYGNMITNIPASLVNEAGFDLGDRVAVSVDNESVNATFVGTYGDVPEGDWLILIEDSAGAVEVARNMENAAETVDGSAGDAVFLMQVPLEERSNPTD